MRKLVYLVAVAARHRHALRLLQTAVYRCSRCHCGHALGAMDIVLAAP
jgi:hypothetical protein